MEHLDFTDPSLWDNCSTSSPSPARFRVPKLVHFIFGLQPDFGGYPFLFVHYMAVKAAHDAVRPDAIWMHYKHEPAGEWWERAKRLVVLKKIEDVPTEVFGKRITNVSHMADVLRLRILLEHGGIYLDSDVIVYRSLDPLLHHTTVLGFEDDDGLCNGLIVAAPNATFLRAWLDAYRSFHRDRWNEHSVVVPLRIAREDDGMRWKREGLCVMPRVSFFYPSWMKTHVEFVHKADEYVFDNGYQYAYHAYNHGSGRLTQELTPDYVRSHNSSITRLLRPFLDADVVGNRSGLELAAAAPAAAAEGVPQGPGQGRAKAAATMTMTRTKTRVIAKATMTTTALVDGEGAGAGRGRRRRGQRRGVEGLVVG
ncbi:hypothetical protein DFJ73DRAFT_666173 [Zopfochytrium polystomum]|nr:hypothetical protein DFJ73DRAFT_666173 [Zopfochytrium polystomum]